MTYPKVALVTGAASGIGRAATWRLAAAGCRVAAIDINAVNLAATAERFPDLIEPFVADVTDADAIGDAAAKTEALFGPVNRVVAAAGVAHVGRLLDVAPEDVLRVMDVNYGGIVRTVAATLPGMLARGRGEVVLFASSVSFTPHNKLGAYAASKCAVVGYAETLWIENRGRGVKIACVCPSAVSTPMAEVFFTDPEKRKKNMAVTPEFVLDVVDNGLRRNQFLVLPAVPTKLLHLLRRFAPRFQTWMTSQPRFDLID